MLRTILNIPKSTIDYYGWIMSKADPRVSDWPLMSQPFTILAIICCYVYLVKSLGPRLMRNRRPFEIRPVIIAYNVLMVLISAWFFYYGGQLTYFPPGGKFSLICEKIDYSANEESMRLVRLGWWLVLLKLVEFLDTIFFVLRKKYSHISALHVIHHAMVPWGLWIGLKFGAGGHNAFFPLINVFIHILMYSYYCLSALGPWIRPYLWWKHYLTRLQILQFVVAFIHSSIPLFVDCGFQPFFVFILIFHAVLFGIMFFNFYRKSYQFSPTRIGTRKRLD